MKGKKGAACPPGQGGKMMAPPFEVTASQRKAGKGKRGKKK